MLEVYCEKSRRITEVISKEDGLHLMSEFGILRLTPVDSRIIRISFNKIDDFEETNEIGIKVQKPYIDWSYEETETTILVSTGKIGAKVNRNTGSIRYMDADGKTLLAEREVESRELEEFDSCLIDEAVTAQIQEVDTADGKKKVIRDCGMKFDRKLYHTRWHLVWQEDEKLYGLGQAQEGVLNLRGTTQYLHQANQKIGIPVLMSTKGYGILLATGSPAIFQDTCEGAYLYTEADRYMDAYLIAGDFDQVIAGVRRLTGKAAMLPMWAYGYIQSQERYETQEEILQIAEEYRNRHIGLDGVVLDWLSWKGDLWGQKSFDETRFPSPEDMLKQLHEKDVHFMISVWPNMNECCDNYQEFLQKGQLLPAGNVYNAFDPKARETYWNQIQRGMPYDQIDSWWCDSSEPYTPEWNHDRKPEAFRMYEEFYEEASRHIPAWKCNTYGLAHAKTIYDGMRGTSKKKRVVNLTRNTYLGGQSLGVIAWSGDIAASWDTYRKQIAAGLNFCVTGLPYWTLDIGAFFVKKGAQWYWNGAYPDGLEDPAYKELYVRWFQFGSFLPMFRAHGTDVRREVWAFGDEKDPYRKALEAGIARRYRLLPYIYSCAGAVWHEDATIMRMLAFDYPRDDRACEVKDQYLFGKDLMVCPVVQPMEQGQNRSIRTVYLPQGNAWYEYDTKTRYEGGQEITVEVLLDQIPLFVKEGSILPVVEEDYECSARLQEKMIALYVFGKQARTIVYEDQGDGYEYETGAYARTELVYDDKKNRLTVKRMDGVYEGRDYTQCRLHKF